LENNIKKLTQKLESFLQEKNFSEKLQNVDDEDLNPLIGQVNDLLEEIKKGDDKLNQYKKSLKAQIAVRTDELKKEKESFEIAFREAQTASNSKSVFLANMNHELRTPLNAIINYSEMLQEEAEAEGLGDFIPDLEKIRSAGRNLLRWVDEILDLSKIESGRAELKLESFDIEQLVRVAETSGKKFMEESGNRLELAFSSGLGEMQADKERTLRILDNLIENANRSTQDGTIAIQVHRERVEDMEWVSFIVNDNGAGIDPKILEALFKDYVNADASVSSSYGGTALSLAISHRFSLIMGGNIFAESELGKGSSFTLRLPAEMEAHLEKPHVKRATDRLLSDIFNFRD
jgi:signal transduction histidine kinase